MEVGRQQAVGEAVRGIGARRQRGVMVVWGGVCAEGGRRAGEQGGWEQVLLGQASTLFAWWHCAHGSLCAHQAHAAHHACPASSCTCRSVHFPAWRQANESSQAPAGPAARALKGGCSRAHDYAAGAASTRTPAPTPAARRVAAKRPQPPTPTPRAHAHTRSHARTARARTLARPPPPAVAEQAAGGGVALCGQGRVRQDQGALGRGLGTGGKAPGGSVRS